MECPGVNTAAPRYFTQPVCSAAAYKTAMLQAQQEMLCCQQCQDTGARWSPQASTGKHQGNFTQPTRFDTAYKTAMLQAQ
jgi:hypothetical protein